MVEHILQSAPQSRRLNKVVRFAKLLQDVVTNVHLVPVAPTRTRAHSGENPDSNGSSNEAQAAITSSRVSKLFSENGWAENGWLASATRAVVAIVAGDG